jgi:hypothetical protein
MMKYESAGSCVVILDMQVQPLGNKSKFKLPETLIYTKVLHSICEQNMPLLCCHILLKHPAHD